MTDKLSGLLAHLDEYVPFDDTEAAFAKRFQQLIASVADPFSHETHPGHITSSAVLYWPIAAEVFQVWHVKAEQWFQPGGHVETDDKTVFDSALRELIEETGFTAENIKPLQSSIFDIDIHPVDVGDKRHDHYDVRYLFTLHQMQAASPESKGRWISLSHMDDTHGPSQQRYTRKLLNW